MVVLDDLGFADFGCFGSLIETPAIDSLAAGGLRYNAFHVTAVCSPTRASLLTGRNHHAVGMGFLPEASGDALGYSGRIPDSAGTLPQVLRDQGYRTFALGKWHLAPRGESTPAGPRDRWPLGMGFDRYYGFLGGWTDQWNPELVDDDDVLPADRVPDEAYHVTEDLVTRAIGYLDDLRESSPQSPYLLYLATGAPHQPHQVPREWIERYRGRFDQGWDWLRQEAFSRQMAAGVVPRGTELTARPPWVTAWDELSADERRVLARQMEVYAAFISHTDAQIGRLVQHLADRGSLENTIILVCSDNGAAGQGGAHGFFAPDQQDFETMLTRLDELGGTPARSFYASGWAWAGNTPFKLWKRYTWLGGVRVPLVLHWPAGTPREERGKIRDQFCHAVDIVPTILDATGTEPPDSIAGVQQMPLHGASLLETIADADRPSRRSTQYFEMMGSRSIFHDGWKATTDHIVSDEQRVQGSRDFDADRWSLYDLRSDFSEAHDVAEQHPDRVSRMIELWHREADRHQVLPLNDTNAPTRMAATRAAEAGRAG